MSSGIYAVGMVGIQALTGINPDQLPTDPDTDEISWRDRTSVIGVYQFAHQQD